MDHISNIRYQPNEDVAIGLLAERCNIDPVIKWQKPQTLEEFLIPPSTEDNEFNLSIDWTFPSPIVDRATIISVQAYDPSNGEYTRVKNVLVKSSKRGALLGRRTLSRDYITIRDNEQSTSSAEDDVIGYCIRQKIASTTYGGVYKGVIMKKRTMHFGESSLIFDALQEKRSKTSLTSITEDDIIEQVEHLGEPCIVSPKYNADGIWEATGEYVAIKISSWFKIRKLRGKHLEDPIKEIQCMQLIGNYHSHFVSHLDALQDDHFLYNVMEDCDEGDLYRVVMNRISSSGRVEECQARHWFRQLLLALHHLQQKGVCHRDISLDNIMVHKDSIKIIDFGMALRVPFKAMNAFGNGRFITDISEGSTRLLMKAQGQGSNWTYMSPEVVTKRSFDGCTHDLWAVGIILYLLLVGRKPFHWAHKSDKQYLLLSENRCLKDTLLYWGISLSDEAFDLLQSMLLHDPHQRLTLSQVLQHPWVKGPKDVHEKEVQDKGKENKKLKSKKSKQIRTNLKCHS